MRAMLCSQEPPGGPPTTRSCSGRSTGSLSGILVTLSADRIKEMVDTLNLM